MRQREPLIGMSGAEVVREFSLLSRNDIVVAQVRFGDSPHQEGVWRDADIRFLPVRRQGDPAPGTERGTVFGQLTPGSPGTIGFVAMDGQGRTAFTAFLEGRRVKEDGDEGLWAERGRGLELIAREGDRVPKGALDERGARFGGRFSDAERIPVRRSEDGKLLFSTRVSLGGRTADIRVLWTDRAGPLEKVAQASGVGSDRVPGDPAPGVPGATFQSFLEGDIVDSGALLFRAILETDDGIFSRPTGLWTDPGSGPELVAVEDGPVPGVGGAVFSTLGSARLLENGAVLFDGSYQGPDGFATGLFRRDPDGSRTLLFQTGQSIGIDGPDNQRVLDRFRVGPGITESGAVALEAFFADGSNGIYTVAVR